MLKTDEGWGECWLCTPNILYTIFVSPNITFFSELLFRIPSVRTFFSGADELKKVNEGKLLLILIALNCYYLGERLRNNAKRMCLCHCAMQWAVLLNPVDLVVFWKTNPAVFWKSTSGRKAQKPGGSLCPIPDPRDQKTFSVAS